MMKFIVGSMMLLTLVGCAYDQGKVHNDASIGMIVKKMTMAYDEVATAFKSMDLTGLEKESIAKIDEHFRYIIKMVERVENGWQLSDGEFENLYSQSVAMYLEAKSIAMVNLEGMSSVQKSQLYAFDEQAHKLDKEVKAAMANDADKAPAVILHPL